MSIFPVRIIILAAVAAAVFPEVAKKCKPAARAVGEGIIKFGEVIKDAAKESESKSASATAPETPTSKAPAAKPKPKTKTAAKKPAARKSSAKAATKPKPYQP